MLSIIVIIIQTNVSRHLGECRAEIKQSLQQIWDASVPRAKVNLGLAYYGDTFALASRSCADPGCPAVGPGVAGNCSQQAGMLIRSEIDSVIAGYGVSPQFDRRAAVKYFSWGSSNQWCVF